LFGAGEEAGASSGGRGAGWGAGIGRGGGGATKAGAAEIASMWELIQQQDDEPRRLSSIAEVTSLHIRKFMDLSMQTQIFPLCSRESSQKAAIGVCELIQQQR